MGGKPFQAGNKSGKGRRYGSRNKKTLFQKALEQGGEEIIEKIKLLALSCDPVAIKLCMERLIPKLQPPNSCFDLPDVETIPDLIQAIRAVTEAVAAGQLSAREGESVARILESHRRAFETADFEARIRALEMQRP